MGNFALRNRKTSPYKPRNELYSAPNRKICAYFTIAGYSIKDKTSYLKEVRGDRVIQENLIHIIPVIGSDLSLGNHTWQKYKWLMKLYYFS